MDLCARLVRASSARVSRLVTFGRGRGKSEADLGFFHELPDDAELPAKHEGGQRNEEQAEHEKGQGNHSSQERPGGNLAVSDCGDRCPESQREEMRTWMPSSTH